MTTPLWGVMGMTPHLVWLLLTKRPQNIADLCPGAWLDSWPSDVWLLLGPLKLPRGPSWVIIGGESGAGSRPCAVEWVQDLRDQCRAMGAAPFIKQLGAKPTLCGVRVRYRRGDDGADAGWVMGRLADAKGGDWSEWPEELRVREFPKVSP